ASGSSTMPRRGSRRIAAMPSMKRGTSPTSSPNVAGSRPRPRLNGKPLDCVGVTGGVGKHDFQPVGPVIHGEGGSPVKLTRRTPESRDQYYAEKITEMAITQQELTRVSRERDALAAALKLIETGDLPNGKLVDPNAQQFAAETLARLEAGE